MSTITHPDADNEGHYAEGRYYARLADAELVRSRNEKRAARDAERRRQHELRNNGQSQPAPSPGPDGWTECVVRVQTRRGAEKQRVWIHPSAPGLAVARNDERFSGGAAWPFSVVHVPSGLSVISDIGSLVRAQAIVRQLASLTNWDLLTGELSRRPDLPPVVYAIQAEVHDLICVRESASAETREARRA